jgi:hypothetical protein
MLARRDRSRDWLHALSVDRHRSAREREERNDAFLTGDHRILARLDRISYLPAALVHGRRDISGPAITVWRLHRMA